MKPVAVGQIGLGEWGLKIGEAVSQTPNMCMVACYDIDAESTHSFAAKFGGKPVSSVEELLTLDELEAVLITTPNHFHYEQAQAAVRKGKHIFLEKPIATTQAEAQTIIELCQNAGVVLAVGHNVRYFGMFRRVKELIQQGDLGDLVLLEANRSMPRGFLLKPGEWRWYQKNLPGGVLSQLGIHMIDTFQYLVGPIQRVYAIASKKKHLPANIVETIILALEFENGALGYIGSSYVIAETFILTVHGTKGTLRADVNEGLFVKRLPSLEWEPVAFPLVNAEVEELEDFAECIRSHRRPQVSGETGAKVLQIAIEALKSAADDKSRSL